jgi:hypothetical protein
MAMTDDERLVKLLARAGEEADHAHDSHASKEHWAEVVIKYARKQGITLTPPPAPEPTFTRTFTEHEWNIVILALNDLQYNEDAHLDLRDRANQLFDAIRNLQPDPEPGA